MPKFSAKFSVPALLGLSVASALAGFEGCGSGGGGGGGGSYAALCQQACDKNATCTGASAATCKSQCGLAAQIMDDCANKAAITSQLQSCIKVACSDFVACRDAIPDCELGGGTSSGGSSGTSSGGSSGTGSGGSSGTSSGGSSGTGSGGSAGGTSCAACAKADSCCIELATAIGLSSSNCKYNTNCLATTGSDRDTFVTMCTDSVAQASGTGIPACQ